MRKLTAAVLLSVFVSYFAYSSIVITPSVDISTVSAPGNDKEILFNDGGDFGFDTNFIFDKANERLGLGNTTPSSALHIKADTPGTVGSAAAGQLIIQNPANSLNANAVVTGYESDGSGGPDQQLWYLGSNSSSNSDITILNRQNANLFLGTNGLTRLTVENDGDIGIGTAFPISLLHISEASTVTAPILSLERVDPSVTTGNPVGILSFLGGEDGSEEQVASITAAADEAWGAATSGSRLVFGTTSAGATNDTERMRIDSSGDVTHTNFTKLGSTAPAIKHKKLTGTGGTAEGWSTNVAHGLGDVSKILSATVLLTAPNGNPIPPGFTVVSEFEYDFFIDPTNVKVIATATNSGSILASSPFVILLTLEK